MYKYYIILILQVLFFTLTNISLAVRSIFILLTMVILSFIEQNIVKKAKKVSEEVSIDLNINNNRIVGLLRLLNIIIMVAIGLMFIVNMYTDVINKYQITAMQVLLFYSITLSVSSIYNIYIVNKFIRSNEHT